MRKAFVTVVIVLMSLKSIAQILTPVKWSTSVKKLSETTYNLIATAKIDAGWHLYSQEKLEDGPIATSFTFEDKGFELIGNTKEGKGHEMDDPQFGMRIKYFENKPDFIQSIELTSKNLSEIKGEVEFMVCDNTRCLPPDYVDLVFLLEKENALINEKEAVVINDLNTSDVNSTDYDNFLDSGLLSIFIISFLSGLAALLTPCVFPMIPLTVSFFTKQSKNKADGLRKAFLYSLFIILIYVILGSLITAIFGADALNALSTNVWFNLIFFLILIVFSVSFLGAFEIRLPSSWANAVDSQSTKGGLVGIFFMALALAIVSFSCTGPIVGTLLVEAASRGGFAPIVGMIGFSSAFALPFGLFAAFPTWMSKLPKSGGWLNTVKVVLGFLELALAMKFLSNVDLVLQLHLLEREVFLAIWIAIFGVLALYLFGKIKLSHDSSSDAISVGRLCFGLFVLSFTIYMIPGLWGAPLKWISAFPPAVMYSESPQGIGFSGGSFRDAGETLEEGMHLGPHNIKNFIDYDKGLAYAKKVKKPILLDFTGYACVNCRKIESNVWSDPKVLDLLKNKFVLISLYVDDKRALLEGEIVTSKISGKKLKYIGQKWSEFQIVHYNINAQPFYVMTDLKGNSLDKPRAYNEDINAYYQWLKKGIQQFEKLSN